MNITFLIGNGFDLNQGVKSDYKSFLEYYQKCSSEIEKDKGDDPDIVAFKKLISKNIRLWSDLEVALGQETTVKPLNTVAGLIKCKRDLDKHLRDFLKAVQSSITFPDTNKVIQDMIRSVEHFSDFFSPQMKNKLDTIFRQHNTESRIYNFVSFNYTDIFDRCFASLPEKFGEHRSGSTIFGHVKGQLVHIHGSIENSMLVGVDNKDQIANNALSENKRVQRYMVKPRMNADSQRMQDLHVKEMIEKSNVIIVFGMAIGETDRTWWKIVAKSVLHNCAQLILVNYQAGIDASFTYDTVDAQEEMIEKFLALCGKTEAEKETIRERVNAYFNTNMFKLPHKILKQEEENTGSVA